ncbi:zinc finger CCCH-type with G patch domain-containing protein [Varanus komodoensis]|uniref:Zinc finger CCCH-type with G patch domain-containing protein n=1 Tax=Varanus komodoensis TaxID=61221 RepID=A0A8D2IMK8_VARKO|nr:zinc finger CCCH-type with G patch domain-containing protein [Varanus komodoensis]XP_044311626.1 zinc finger CCCH-type with G patch domain-containing protein [Varanus komodoensis]XP_044311627.1 zinc finger CCCH-type with G patch domain-containing protein [Varanus komodoensis]
MDEQSLEEAIQSYTAQLQQVELALGAGLDPSQQTDLTQLRADLQQLIELTESSLASVKKSRLCSTLGPETLSTSPSSALQQDGPQSGKLSIEDEYAAFKEAVAETGDSEAPSSTGGAEGGGAEELEEEEASGMKVKAPYYSSWGTLEYHNAMVVGSECLEDGSPGVRVLYLYPTHKSLKPCPFFLDDKCRFKENCRFSHGQVVSVEELRPFEEPDLGCLAVGSACLARHQDGIWYAAKITDIDSGYYTVKFDSLLLKEAVVEGDGIMPPLRGEESSSSESEDGNVDDDAYAQVIDWGTPENGEGSSACSSSFGSWEVHTRGIGSKLLARMGYELGKGLGKNSEGRVEPVLAVVLPKGKSLDQCAETLRKKREGTLGPTKPRKQRAKGTRAARLSQQGPKSRNVFDFLNEKLQGKRPSEADGGQAPLERSGKEIYHASKSTKKALSVRLFQTMEGIERAQKDIRGIQEALARNAGRHTIATAQLEEKLAGARKKLGELQAQEASLQREQKKADTHKKMTEF